MIKIIKTNNLIECQEQADLAEDNTLIVYIANEVGVLTNSHCNFNKDYCIENNIPIAYGKYIGGTIVNFPGDLSLCLTTKERTTFGQDVYELSIGYLESKGLNPFRDNNDTLLNKKKVISWASGICDNGFYQTVIHFSINSNIELINNICTKKMVKIPGALFECNITGEELFDIIYNQLIVKEKEDNDETD